MLVPRPVFWIYDHSRCELPTDADFEPFRRVSGVVIVNRESTRRLAEVRWQPLGGVAKKKEGIFPMIHVIATIRTVPGGQKALLAAFRDLVPLVHAERGCIEYGTAVDLETPIQAAAAVRDEAVTVVEKWESVAALEDHLVAPHMLKHRARVKDLVSAVEIRVLAPA
jgi:quinol monooxygenase YgiN